MSVEKLIASKNPIKIWIAARYFYRIGDPIITDELYEQYTELLKEHPNTKRVLNEYFIRTYDEDPIPYGLLREFDIEPEEQSVSLFSQDPEYSRYFDALNEDKSLSCRAVVSYEEAWEFFNRYRELQKDLMISLKMDGINTKSIYNEGKLKLSLSRGRSSESFDFTEQTKLVLPKEILITKKDLKITGESFVTYEGVSKLRQDIDNTKYKTCKSSAISLLRVRHDIAYYRFLKTVIFSAEGLASTLAQTFKLLEEAGFSVVPYKLIKWEEIPNDFERFREWAKSEIFDYMWKFGETMPSDGIVIEVNDLTFFGEQKDQYSDRQIALKFEQWSFNTYTGIVKNILWRQNRVHASIRVEIEPMETVDGCTAQFINVFNPAILISNHIRIGSLIHFERNSDAVNILIQNSRLENGKVNGILASESNYNKAVQSSNEIVQNFSEVTQRDKQNS
mgnify:CR=1 FL=1